MSVKLVSSIISRLAFVLVGSLAIPWLMSLYAGEECERAFFMSVVIASVIALHLRHQAGDIESGTLSIREGIAVTGFGWILMSVIGMLPYFFGGYLGLLDSLFESISGFTGTGATVMPTIEGLPYSLLFWRMMTNWIGGLGIIVIFIAILPQSGSGTIHMYNAEGIGPLRGRVVPRLGDMSLALFKMYIIFTAIVMGVYMLCGAAPGVAVTHAMSTVSGGGFSTFDDSAMHFGSVAFELCMALFMFLAGGNLLLYYQAYKKGSGELKKNLEFRSYFKIQLAAMILISVGLILSMDKPILTALREAFFQVTSLSTTGFVSADFEQWPSYTKWILLVLMMIGGCAGSTASGIKVARIIILVQGLRALIKRRLHSNSIFEVVIGGNRIDEEIMWRVGIFFVLYLAVIAVTTLLLAVDGLVAFDAIAIAISTMGNIGPAFGVAGATSTYAGLSAFAKSVLLITMLLGRLEIFTLLVLFRAEFWRRTRQW